MNLKTFFHEKWVFPEIIGKLFNPSWKSWGMNVSTKKCVKNLIKTLNIVEIHPTINLYNNYLEEDMFGFFIWRLVVENWALPGLIRKQFVASYPGLEN